MLQPVEPPANHTNHAYDFCHGGCRRRRLNTYTQNHKKLAQIENLVSTNHLTTPEVLDYYCQRSKSQTRKLRHKGARWPAHTQLGGGGVGAHPKLCTSWNTNSSSAVPCGRTGHTLSLLSLGPSRPPSGTACLHTTALGPTASHVH